MDSMNDAYFALKRPVGGLYTLLHMSCRVAKAVEINSGETRNITIGTIEAMVCCSINFCESRD